MAVTKRSSPYGNGKIGKRNESVSAGAWPSETTAESVVVFSRGDDFVVTANEALIKQRFTPLPIYSQAHLEDYCSKGYLNYLLDCERLDFRKASSFIATIRSRVPDCHVIAYCPNAGWKTRLREAGADVVIDSPVDLTLRIMETSLGFLHNVAKIASRLLTSSRRRIKEATLRSRMEKTAAAAADLSIEHMLQTDANMRAFCANSWPVSRHGQFVAITGGETIGFGGSAGELAEHVRTFEPSGNILIQRIDCEDDSLRRHVT